MSHEFFMTAVTPFETTKSHEGHKCRAIINNIIRKMFIWCQYSRKSSVALHILITFKILIFTTININIAVLKDYSTYPIIWQYFMCYKLHNKMSQFTYIYLKIIYVFIIAQYKINECGSVEVTLGLTFKKMLNRKHKCCWCEISFVLVKLFYSKIPSLLEDIRE
jgi:hypothetical protein